MSYPVPERFAGSVWFLALIACAGLWWFGGLDVPKGPVRGYPESDPNRHGVRELALARTPERAGNILADWRRLGLTDRAREAVRADFYFIAAYVLALATSCAMAERGFTFQGWMRPAALGVPIAWLMVLAGAGDVVENLALLEMLRDGPQEPWPLVATVGAAVKFGLILLVGLPYILVGLALRIVTGA